MDTNKLKSKPTYKNIGGKKVDLYPTSKNTVTKVDAVGLAKKYGM